MNWKRWRWLNEGVLPLAMVVMRLCTAWLWLAMLSRWAAPSHTGSLLPTPLMLLIILLAMLSARFLSTHTARLNRARWIMAAAGGLVLAVTLWLVHFRNLYALWQGGWVVDMVAQLTNWRANELPPVFLSLVFGAYLWLRGTIDGQRDLKHRDVRWGFNSGIITLVLFVLLAQLDQSALPPQASGIIFLFFGAAMVGFSFASLKVVPASPNLRQPMGQLRLHWYWLGSVVTIIVVLISAGLLVNLLVDPKEFALVVDWSWQIVSRVMIFVLQVASLLLYPILLGLSRLVPAIVELLGQNFGSFPQFAAPGSWQTPYDPARSAEQVGALPDGARWISIILFFGLLGLMFAMALRRFKGRMERLIDNETREWIISSELLQRQLQALQTAWLIGRGRVRPLTPFLSLQEESSNRRRIRAVYQELLARAGQQGITRQPHQTPSVFAMALARQWPQFTPAVDTITFGYEQARYAQRQPSTDLADHVEIAWSMMEKEWVFAADAEQTGNH